MKSKSVEQPTWKISSYSNQGNCVEVAATADGVLLRNSHRRDGPMLKLRPRTWQDFVDGLRSGSMVAPSAAPDDSPRTY